MTVGQMASRILAVLEREGAVLDMSADLKERLWRKISTELRIIEAEEEEECRCRDPRKNA